MFNITNNKGFHMTFANGWTVSIQWGGENYCSNYNLRIYEGEVPPSDTAEMAAFKGEEWYQFDNDQVIGYLKADEVLKYMNIIANKP